MRLSSPLFEQIVAALGPAREEAASASADSTEAEKRTDQRLAFDAGVLLKPFGVASALPRMVRLRNLSRSGAAVLDGGTRQIGEKVVLYLPRPDGSTVALVCAVMNTRISGGAFRLGMQFIALVDQRDSGCAGGAGAWDAAGPNARQPAHVLDELARRGSVIDGDEEHGSNRPRRVRVGTQGLLCGDEYGHAGLTRFVTVHEVDPAGVVSVLHPELLARGVRFTLQIACPAGEMLTMLCTTSDSRQIDESNCLIEARFEVKPKVDAMRPGGALPATGLMQRLKRWFAA